MAMSVGPHTVVLVEDERPARDMFRRMIAKRSERFQIVGEAVNGVQGLELCERLKPDFVVTDLTMPVMGGLELMRTLRQSMNQADWPRMVILSCHQEFRYAQQAIAYGAASYLLKDECLAREHLLIDTLDMLANDRADDAPKRMLDGVRRPLFYRGEKPLEAQPLAAEDEQEQVHPVGGEWLEKLRAAASMLHADDPLWSDFKREAAQGLWSPDEVVQTYVAALESVRPLQVEAESDVSRLDRCAAALREAQTLEQADRLVRDYIRELRERNLQDKTRRLVAGVMKEIEERLSDVQPLDYYARKTGYSVPYFSELFKACAGCTFTDYVLERRMEKARMLLLLTDLKTYEIAEKIGLVNYRHFNRLFKRCYRVSPRSYREQAQKEAEG